MTYSGYYGNDAITYQLLGLLSAWGVLIVALLVLAIVAGWKIFSKAGEPGWGSLVPFYHSYIEFKIFWGNGWLFLAPIGLSLLSVAPVIGPLFAIINIVIVVMTKYKKSLAFGEGVGFCLGLIFLPTIFNLILGLSTKYQYLGVPQDGVTYKDLKKKYDDVNERPMTYEEKPEEQARPMTYEKPVQPETKPVEETKVEAEEVKPTVEPTEPKPEVAEAKVVETEAKSTEEPKE